MKGKQLGTAIKEAINAHGKYVPLKIWGIDISEADFRNGTQDIVITVTVRQRKRKKQ